jgi:hypothetical protein
MPFQQCIHVKRKYTKTTINKTQIGITVRDCVRMKTSALFKYTYIRIQYLYVVLNSTTPCNRVLYKDNKYLRCGLV